MLAGPKLMRPNLVGVSFYYASLDENHQCLLLGEFCIMSYRAITALTQDSQNSQSFDHICTFKGITYYPPGDTWSLDSVTWK